MEPVQPSSPVSLETWQTIRDPLPLEARPVALTGWFERQKFHPLFLAFLVIVLGFIMFQVVAALAVVMLHLPVLAEGGDPMDLAELIFSDPNKLFGANAIGQFVGLLMLTLLVTRLHTPDILGYLRIQKSDLLMLLFFGRGPVRVDPFCIVRGGVDATDSASRLGG